MDKEAFDRVIKALEVAFRKKPAPAPVEGSHPGGKETPKAVKSETPAASKSVVVAESTQSSKPIDAEVVRNTFIEAAAKQGHPLTAGEKLSVLLSKDLQVEAGIENQALIGCISRLSGLNFNEALAETWQGTQDILATRINTPLSDAEIIVQRELRQAAGEYYYRNKDFFDKARVPLEKDPNHPLFNGVQERMTRDDQAIYFGAHSEHEANTQAWAEDISEQILNKNKQAPDLKVTVTLSEAQEAITSQVAADSSFSWLINTGEVPRSDASSQVVYDILTSGDLSQNKEYFLVKGAQLKYAEAIAGSTEHAAEVRQYRERILSKVRELYGVGNDAEHVPDGKQDLFNTITHHLLGFESGMMPPTEAPGGGPRIWNGTKCADPKYDDLVEEIQNKFDVNPKKFMGDWRGLQNAIDRLSGAGPEKLAIMGDPHLKLEAMYARLSGNILEPWNSISTSGELQEKLILYPEDTTNEGPRFTRKNSDFWAEGVFAQSNERNLAKLAELMSNNDFSGIVKKYMLAHIADIEAAYGGLNIDPDHPELHVFYIERLGSLKKIYDNLNTNVALERLYGAKKTGIDLAKIRDAAANYADSGQARTKAANGGVNHLAYDIYNATLRELQQNFHTGTDQRLTGVELEMANLLLLDYLRENAKILEPIWQSSLEKKIDIKGGPTINREFNLEVQADIARQVRMLSAVTGAEDTAIMMGLSPSESAGQNGQSADFSGTMGNEVAIKARSPIRWFFQRWDLLGGSTKDHLRIMVDMYAKSIGADKFFDQMMAKMPADYKNDPEYKALLSYVFHVTEADPVKRAAQEESVLQYYFEKTLDQHDRKPPKRLADVDKKLLKEAYLFKVGIDYADAVTGAYGYEESYMYTKGVLAQKEFIFGKGTPLSKLVGLEHEERNAGMGVINAETEHELEHAKEALVEVEKTIADYLPHRHLEKFMKHRSIAMRRALREDIAAGKFSLLVKGTNITENATQNMRWDIVVRELEKRYLLIDALQAKEGLVPHNYQSATVEPAMMLIMEKVCDSMGTAGSDNVKIYLDAMKTISDRVRTHDMLHELTEGQYLDSLRTISGESAYIKFFEKPLECPGNQWIGKTLTKFERDQIAIVKMSTHIGGEKGLSRESIMGRYYGDTAGAVENTTTTFWPLIGAGSDKELVEGLPKAMHLSLFTGGRKPKNRMGIIITASWLKMVATDRVKDALLLNSQPDSSAHKRAVGENGISIGLNEQHHVYDAVQAAAKTKFKEAIPELASEVEKQLHLIWKIRKPWGGHWETNAPVWIYRLYLFGILGAIIAAIQAKEDAQKGFSEGSGSGGTGGNSSQHPH